MSVISRLYHRLLRSSLHPLQQVFGHMVFLCRDRQHRIPHLQLELLISRLV
jgi:hypothetical protein